MVYTNKKESVMDKDFEQKVKRKKIRAVIVAIVLIGLGIYMLLDINVEKADYSKDLDKTITSAQKVLQKAKETGHGNREGQYAKYTLLAFDSKIKEAEEIAQSEQSAYNDKKLAYERLKEAEKIFKKDTNKDILTTEEVKHHIEKKDTEDITVKVKKKTEITYTVDGKKLKKPSDLNFMARTEGPYEKDVNRFFSETALKGTTISLYQEGSYNGTVEVTLPVSNFGKDEKAYVYKFDSLTGIMTYLGEGRMDSEKKHVSFDVTEGGVYLVTPSDFHSGSEQKDLIIEDVIRENKAEVSVDPSGETVEVSIEIRCDVLAEDPSKLKKPELKDYVPEDGEILKKTKVTMNKGQTVFDVLNKVCRDNNIQLETSYTPTYASYYVEGINYLYEFDAGNLSGWTYQVNGKTPNYGCSSFRISDGDEITWQYTCDLGKDVGSYVGD